jgi:hypothetical protein
MNKLYTFTLCCLVLTHPVWCIADGSRSPARVIMPSLSCESTMRRFADSQDNDQDRGVVSQHLSRPRTC